MPFSFSMRNHGVSDHDCVRAGLDVRIRLKHCAIAGNRCYNACRYVMTDHKLRISDSTKKMLGSAQPPISPAGRYATEPQIMIH